MCSLPPSLSSLLALQLRASPFSARRAFSSTSLSLKAAETPFDKRMKELQAKQLKMAEKQGRMKLNVNSAKASSIPPFATYIRPGKNVLSSSRYASAPPGRTIPWLIQDARQDFNTWTMKRQIQNSLGKDWTTELLGRSTKAYEKVLIALAYGQFDPLKPFATPSFLSSLQSTRIASFKNLKLSLKAHSPVRASIVCAVQQELDKKGEFLGQVAVRLESLQSLEIRDTMGNLVGSGRHETPEEVTEYYIFARELWRPTEDNWKILTKAKEVDPDNMLGEQ